MSKHDYDPGCSVLDLIAACDEGRQSAALEEEVADARRRVLAQGGGKMTVTLKVTMDIQNVDECLVVVGFEIKRPKRKQATAERVFLDTDLAGDERGNLNRKVIGSTMHLRNPRQTTIAYTAPRIVSDEGSKN